MMFTASAAVVVAAPTGPSGADVTSGAAVVTLGPDTKIVQNQNRVDINWTGFDTLATESVTFEQPSSLSLAVNRISGNRTQFDGTLSSNGRIFLINQNGITFGSTAQVNVGSLLATTSKLESSTADDLSHDFSSKAYGSIINEGDITVSDGGFAVLAAPYVKNSGFIKADLGQVELASTNDFTINVDLRGDDLITFSAPLEIIEGETDTLGVDSNGTLQSKSGHVYLSARIISGIVEGVVNLSGVVDADQFVSAPNGDLEMVASADLLRHYPGGTIKVDSIGDINIDGGADIHAIGGDRVSATFHATRNISVGATGGPVAITLCADECLTVDGPADEVNGGSSTAHAEARLEMIASSLGGKGTLTIADADIKVTAYASDTGGIIMDPAASDINGDGTISAVATAILEGPEVEINADIIVLAEADASSMVHDGPDMVYDDPYYVARPADALAVLDVFAKGEIEFDPSGNPDYDVERGDLTMVSDITVRAISTTHDSMNSKATANTMLVATGSTDVTGKINVDAIATSESGPDRFVTLVEGDINSVEANIALENIEGETSADANAALVLLGGTPPGLIPLLREVSLNYIGPLGTRFEPLGTLSDILTLANLDDVLGFFAGIDPGDFFERLGGIGPGSVSYTGDSNINAVANFNTTGSDNGTSDLHGEGKAEATSAAYYVAGGDVYINTDPIKVYSEANADYKEIPDEPGDLFVETDGSYVETEARSFLVAAAGLDEYFNGGSENEPHSEITVLGNLSTEAWEQASLTVGDIKEPNPGMYNQLAAAVTALVATGDITVRGADPLAMADPAVAQGRTSRWQVCRGDTCDPVVEGVDGLIDLAKSSAGDPNQEGPVPVPAEHLAQIVIESLYGDIDIQPKSIPGNDIPGNDVQPTGLFTDPIGPIWPGDLPLRFDANGRMLVATGRDATKPPQIVALDSSVEDALLAGGDPSVLLPPTAAGGCLAAGRDAFTISRPGYFERMISSSCETAE